MLSPVFRSLSNDPGELGLLIKIALMSRLMLDILLANIL